MHAFERALDIFFFFFFIFVDEEEEVIYWKPNQSGSDLLFYYECV